MVETLWFGSGAGERKYSFNTGAQLCRFRATAQAGAVIRPGADYSTGAGDDREGVVSVGWCRWSLRRLSAISRPSEGQKRALWRWVLTPAHAPHLRFRTFVGKGR